MPFLEVLTRKGVKRVALRRDAVTIGRHPQCTLVLTDDRSSRKHCVIEPCDDGFRVRDLGSRNGTKLNDRRVSEKRLDHNDIIRVGKVEIRFIDEPLDSEPIAEVNEPDDEYVSPFPRKGDPPSRNQSAHAAGNDAGESDDAVTVLTDIPLQPSRDSDRNVSYEQQIRPMVDALPENNFEAQDISLIDNRGDMLHAAGKSADRRRSEENDVSAGLRAFRMMLLICFRARASDLHIEPKGDHASVRLRVDGSMVNLPKLEVRVFSLILGLIKVLCQVDTTRKSIIQDGHFSALVPGRRIDFRVSLMPSVGGQKMVLRILDTAAIPTRLHELGMVPWMYEKLKSIVDRDSGMVLASGPTGSGKTTTLYSCLREIDVDQRNVVTIEDPVEYSLEGCTQIPIDSKQGHSFNQMLRSVLRQDPDVILLGEIRDPETAATAAQASMTGHLVLSTVHSKDSISTIFRLLDLGLEAYLVANSLNLIIAQRLVRVLCESCRQPVRPSPAQSMRLGRFLESGAKIYEPSGCPRCLKTGFHGRRAIFELLEFTSDLRDVVLRRPTIHDIREVVGAGLFNSLAQSGYQLVAKGVTSLEEVARVAGWE